MSRNVNPGCPSSVRRSMKALLARNTGSPVHVVRHRRPLRLHEALQHRPLPGHPTRQCIRHRLEPDRHPLLPGQPRDQHVQLQRPHHPHDGLAAVLRPEQLHHPPPPPTPATPFATSSPFIASSSRTRRKISGAKYGTPTKFSRSSSLKVSPDPQRPMVRDAHHVPGIRLVRDLPVPREEELRRMQRDQLPRPHLHQPHPSLQPPRAHTRERDPVPVVGVHVRLYLEHQRCQLCLVPPPPPWCPPAAPAASARSPPARPAGRPPRSP